MACRDILKQSEVKAAASKDAWKRHKKNTGKMEETTEEEDLGSVECFKSILDQHVLIKTTP
jgi:hypothetical protein